MNPRLYPLLSAAWLGLAGAVLLCATPSSAAANRTLPQVEPPAATLQLSETPTAHELSHAHALDEPLVPIGGEPEAVENHSLGRALRRHANRADVEDRGDLHAFLLEHPRSKWTASILTSLGADYLRSGYYSKALDSWQKAWTLAKDATNTPAKAVADRAGGELALLYARFGYVGQLEELLREFEHRSLLGGVTEKISGARQALWAMKNVPEITFRCGPLALDRIRAAQDPNLAANPYIQDSHATTNGYSLAQLQQLSRDLGMFCQVAFRQRGAEILTPSVVHWKLGHYAAIIRKEGNHYLVHDPSSVGAVHLTAHALDEESSGYFLVLPGPLPVGWRVATEAEGATTWGKGVTHDNEAGATTPHDQKKSPPCGTAGMAVPNVHLMLVSLNLADTPVGYQPPVGPAVAFSAIYNQREAYQPANFNYSSLGPKWTFNWLSYLVENPTIPSADVYHLVAGGGLDTFSGFNSVSGSWAVQTSSHALLKRLSTNSFEMAYPDGSKLVYDLPDGGATGWRKVFLTRILDSASNTVQLTYDARFRIVAVRDAIGQVTTLAYGQPSDLYKVTQVTDPFNRSAFFSYDSLGRLTNITDVLGLNSQFTYAVSNDFIKALTTPYGTSRFAYGEAGRTRWLETTDPLGNTDRVEFSEDPNVGTPNQRPASMIPKGMFIRNRIHYARNTYVWGQKAYAEARNDYTKAEVYHWLHSEDYQSAVGILEDVKQPFENPVWFNYPGQVQSNEGATLRGSSDRPTKIGRVLDDGTTQLYRLGYNALGNVTNAVDPVGRTSVFLYATNGTDLVEIRERGTNGYESLARMTYNGQHRPLTLTDAAGQTTTLTYNARGQLLTTRNPLGETSTFNYDANGYLLSVDGPISGTADSTWFTYNARGLARTVTDSENYTLTFDYDNFDRPTRVTYPDGTYEEVTYNRLDAVVTRDRVGHLTQRSYDANRRLVAVQDALDRVTRFNWCGCGALEGLVDPMGRTTQWFYDLQGRTTAKQYVDGSRIEYHYEATTSRLKQIKDEKGQFKNYDYFVDNNLKQVSYPNALVATPTVAFTYDTNYNRQSTMTDAFGLTTYSYVPVTTPPAFGAGLLASRDGPLPNDTVSYSYDALGRVMAQALNGVGESYSYDALGRVFKLTNVLGRFTNAFVRNTALLAEARYPNGQKTTLTYWDNLHDQRLNQIETLDATANLVARHTYTYDGSGFITNWIQALGTDPVQTHSFAYDSVGRLTSAVARANSTAIATYSYGYDSLDNRTLEVSNSASFQATYNPLNQLVTRTPGSVSPNRTLEWDAENRLVTVQDGTNRFMFAYDGLGRRVRILSLAGSQTNTDLYYVWCGLRLSEERAGTNAVQKRYFGQGWQEGAANYFFASDHLGSVRGVLDSNGRVLSSLAYSPYGGVLAREGSVRPPFTYASYFEHQQSGLLLAIYRPYDPALGSWLGRDPSGERTGLNLYGYVGGDPINMSDPLGLFQWNAFMNGFNNSVDEAFAAGVVFAALGVVLPETILALVIVGTIAAAVDLIQAGQTIQNPCMSDEQKSKFLGSVMGSLSGGLAGSGSGIAASVNPGIIKWEVVAPNSGFLTGPGTSTLLPGQQLIRYGPDGRFVGFPGASPSQLGLPPWYDVLYSPRPLQLARPVNVEAGIARPAWGRGGGATQMRLPGTVNQLISSGTIIPR